MFSRSFTISALLSVAAAQLPNISQNCTTTLTSIASNPDVNNCLKPSPLLTIFTNSANTSVVQPIDTWLIQLCAAAPCSNDTLAAVVNNATAGCSTELTALGYQAGDNSAIIAAVQQYYPTVRKVACLKDGNTNCITETLQTVESVAGPLSVNNAANIISGQATSQIPQNVTCSNCAKAAYNIAQQSVPGLIPASAAQAQCGQSFTDGQNPSGVTQTASDNASSQGSGGNGALGLSMAPGVSALFALFGAFTVLA